MKTKNAAVDAQGLVYYFLDQSRLDYCNGNSRKFCRFLDKYDGTIWADAENYYSDFSDINFQIIPILYPSLILIILLHIVKGGK